VGEVVTVGRDPAEGEAVSRIRHPVAAAHSHAAHTLALGEQRKHINVGFSIVVLDGKVCLFFSQVVGAARAIDTFRYLSRKWLSNYI
jgi:hypothetical protein